MDSAYHESLQLVKGSFRGTSETPILVELIASSITSTIAKILDVGIGTGEQMSKVSTLLSERGISALITGIDVFVRQTDGPHGTINFLEGDFATKELPDKYDVVNATQSLYYFHDLDAVLKKMIGLLTSPGTLTLTVWTKECLLNQLYQKFFKESDSEAATDRTVVAALSSLVDPKCIEVRYFDGEIDLNAILHSDSTLQAFLHILSRRGSVRECDKETIQQARNYIAALGNIGRRKNAIISVRLPC
jgi:SAM-dependent methyltransferase